MPWSLFHPHSPYACHKHHKSRFLHAFPTRSLEYQLPTTPLISGQRCGSCVARTLFSHGCHIYTLSGLIRALSQLLPCRFLSSLPTLLAFLVRVPLFLFTHLRLIRDQLSRFSGPFSQNVNRSLTISNYNALPVAFKVKTTAPNVCAGFSVSDSRMLISSVRSLAVLRKAEFRSTEAWSERRPPR